MHFIVGTTRGGHVDYTRVRFFHVDTGGCSCAGMFASGAYSRLHRKIARASVQGVPNRACGGLTATLLGNSCGPRCEITRCHPCRGPGMVTRIGGASACDLHSGPANVCMRRNRRLAMLMNSAGNRGLSVVMRSLELNCGDDGSCTLGRKRGAVGVLSSNLICVRGLAGRGVPLALRARTSGRTTTTGAIGVRFPFTGMGNCFSTRANARTRFRRMLHGTGCRSVSMLNGCMRVA